MSEMVKMYEQNTGQEVKTAVADSRYGTMENYLFCHDSGIQAHICSLEETPRGSGVEGIYFRRKLSLTIRKRMRWSAPVARNYGGVIFPKSAIITNTRLIPECVADAG